MVLAACRRVLGDPHDVQDAFQATFLVLVRNARSIRKRQSVAGWLQSVAYRVACSARSADGRRRLHESGYAAHHQRGCTSEVQLDEDLKAVIDQELSRLPERQRGVIVLCDVEGLTYEQAAVALGWPTGTVKSRLARGRERLRSRLIRRGVSPSLAIVGKSWLEDAATTQVPSLLIHSTINAVVTAGLSRFKSIPISPGVLKLMEDAMTSLFLAKAKLYLAALAVGSCVAATTISLTGPRLTAAAQESRYSNDQTENAGKPTAKIDLDLTGELAALKLKLAELTVQNGLLKAEVLELQKKLSTPRVQEQENAGSTSVSRPRAKHDPSAANQLPDTSKQTAPRAAYASDLLSNKPNKQATTSQTQAWSPNLPASPQHEPYLRAMGLIFAASPAGSKVVAHNPLTQKDQFVSLNASKESPIEVGFVSDRQVVGLNLKGTKITRTAAYDWSADAWVPLELSEPVSGELKSSTVGNGTVVYDAGRHHYTYSARSAKWDHLDRDAIKDE
jgi:RNA polymerase sigma factor (sigma-70 family)